MTRMPTRTRSGPVSIWSSISPCPPYFTPLLTSSETTITAATHRAAEFLKAADLGSLAVIVRELRMLERARMMRDGARLITACEREPAVQPHHPEPTGPTDRHRRGIQTCR